MRRSQGHLGAQSSSALARAGTRVLADRRPALSRPRSHASSRAGWTPIRRSSESTGRACWSWRSDRSHGSGRLTSSPAIRDDETPWLVDLVVALDRQLMQIERNLSYYFSPNTHLLGEALALYVCGRALPWLAAAARYERIGRRVLLNEIARQIAADGGHRERSTHYHRYTLDFYLLARRDRPHHRRSGGGARSKTRPARLGFAARLLADDRGLLPHIGDDDGGSTWPLAGRAVDDIRDSLAVASVLTAQPDLRIGPMPEEACWLLAHPRALAGRRSDHSRPPEPIAIRRAGRERLFRIALRRRRSSRRRRRASRIPQCGPRPRRCARADVHGARRPLPHRLRHRLVYGRSAVCAIACDRARCTTR